MTLRHVDHEVVVIGAGPAGASAADSLQRAGRDVLVIEAGGPNTHPAFGHANFFAARSQPDAWRTDVTVRHTAVQDWQPYRQGKGFGGGAAVNGLVCMPGDEWTDPADQTVANELMGHTTTYRPSDPRLGTALLHAWGSAPVDTGAPWAVGAGAPQLWAHAATPFERLRLPMPHQLLLHTQATRIEPGSIVTVHTNAGAITANSVMLCAGAIQTARLVSPLAPDGSIGNAVQDHAAIRLSIRLTEQARMTNPMAPVVSCTARWRSDEPTTGLGPANTPIDMQMLVLDAIGTSHSDTHHGVVMVALMGPRSRGTLRFGQDGAALLDLNMLHDPHDRVRLRRALRRVIRVLSNPALASVIGEVLIDDHGTPLSSAAHLYTDDAESDAQSDIATDAWMMQTAGDYSHVVGTCPAGTITGTGHTLGLLHGTSNIWLADASLFTSIPTVNTMVPTMVLARSVARRIGGH